MYKLLLNGGLHYNKSILIRPILVNKHSCYYLWKKYGSVEKREENDSISFIENSKLLTNEHTNYNRFIEPRNSFQ